MGGGGGRRQGVGCRGRRLGGTCSCMLIGFQTLATSLVGNTCFFTVELVVMMIGIN